VEFFWAESLGRHRATADLIGHHSLVLVAYKKVSEIIKNVQLETIRFEKSSFNPLLPYNFSKKPFSPSHRDNAVEQFLRFDLLSPWITRWKIIENRLESV
jgi:hypothetical protein